MDENWLKERTFHHRDFADLEALAERKAELGIRVSLALPTINVARTLGPILEVCRPLKDKHGLIDQLALFPRPTPHHQLVVKRRGKRQG